MSLLVLPSTGSYSFIIEYSSLDHSLSIPGELLVQMVIRKAEERAMGIQEQDTVNFRERFAIPDSFYSKQ